MEAVGILFVIGLPVLIFIVLPMAFLNSLDKQNPPNPDMW